jgi:hypothetical protein
MLEDAVIVGLVMTLAEIIKQLAKRAGLADETVKQVVTPLAVFALAGGINVLAALVWAPELFWREALKQGLMLGAVSGGVYSLGKAALGKS